MKLEQIDWVKELEEEKELAEWLENDKEENFGDSPLNWWKYNSINEDIMEEVGDRINNILYRGLMKKLNR